MTATDLAGNTTTVTQTLTVDTVLPLIAINPGPDDATNDEPRRSPGRPTSHRAV